MTTVALVALGVLVVVAAFLFGFRFGARHMLAVAEEIYGRPAAERISQEANGRTRTLPADHSPPTGEEMAQAVTRLTPEQRDRLRAALDKENADGR